MESGMSKKILNDSPDLNKKQKFNPTTIIPEFFFYDKGFIQYNFSLYLANNQPEFMKKIILIASAILLFAAISFAMADHGKKPKRKKAKTTKAKSDNPNGMDKNCTMMPGCSEKMPDCSEKMSSGACEKMMKSSSTKPGCCDKSKMKSEKSES